MPDIPTWETLPFLLTFLVPGLVSMGFFRLIYPPASDSFSTTSLQAFFYSSLNFVLTLPVILPILQHGLQAYGALRLWATFLLCIVVLPLLWPYLYIQLSRHPKFSAAFQLPWQTGWDYFMSHNKPRFALVHLKNGTVIAGYFGEASYAASSRHGGDIYFEAVYHVDEKGRIGEIVRGTAGAWVGRDEYYFLEFLEP